jgi:hypothetical protein
MSGHDRDEGRNAKGRPSVRNGQASKGDKKFDHQGSQTPDRRVATAATIGADKAIDLSVEPHWDQIEEVRKKTRAFLRSHGLSKELVDALIMVSSELVENGLKYGTFGDKGKKLRFNLHIGEKNVIVEVTHPTSAEAAQHLRRLDKTIQWIRGFQDPFQAYLEKLKEVAQRPIHDSESGLGLVRIAYEGKSIIDFFVAENNALNVCAIAGVEKGLWR